MQQRVVVLAGEEDHVAAVSAITTAGTATRNELLAPERKTAITSVARLYADSYFINKHGRFQPESGESGDLLGENFVGVRGGFSAGVDGDEFARTATITKYHDTWDFGEQGVVFTASDIFTRLVDGAALANQDGTAGDHFSAKTLHTKPLGIGIAPVFGTA
jgi:hypothetical protein